MCSPRAMQKSGGFGNLTPIVIKLFSVMPKSLLNVRSAISTKNCHQELWQNKLHLAIHMYSLMPKQKYIQNYYAFLQIIGMLHHCLLCDENSTLQ